MASAREIVDAERARRLYPRSRGLQTAYRNGAAAARRGETKSVCPYGAEQATTWRRAFRLAWMRGWYSVVGPTGMSLDFE